MTKAMSNIGAPGPFQTSFSMFSSQNCASDQRDLMEGANQHHDQPSVGAGGEGHVSHSAKLNHAESTARIKEILESNSGGFQAMSGHVQIQSTEDSEDTPRDDDEMSDNEGSQQTNLVAVQSTRCPMWLLYHIKSTDVSPLCSKEL